MRISLGPDPQVLRPSAAAAPTTPAVLLLNFNNAAYAGADPRYVDESIYAHQLNAVAGTTPLTTAVAGDVKFGPYAHYQSALWAPAHAAFKPGAGDFTIHFWSKRTATSLNINLFTVRLNSTGNALTDFILRCYSTASNQLIAYLVKSGGAAVANFFSGTGPSAGTGWCNGAYHHIAMERFGDITTGYIDGAIDQVDAITGSAFDPGAVQFTLGAMCNAQGSYQTCSWGGGGLDAFQWVPKALYRGLPFTPPAAPPQQYA